MMGNLLIWSIKNHLIRRNLKMKVQRFYRFLNQKLSFLTDNMLNDNSLIFLECCSCVGCVCCICAFYSVSRLSLSVLQFQLPIDGHDKILLLTCDYQYHFLDQVSRLGIYSFLSMCPNIKQFFKEIKEENTQHYISDMKPSLSIVWETIN